MGQGPPAQGLAPEFAGQGAPGGAGARLLEAAAACCVVEALEQLISRLARADQAEVAPLAPRSCRRQVPVRMLAIACQFLCMAWFMCLVGGVELARPSMSGKA